ncbi:cellulose synthase subunit BcsC-related outer membrane protein [Undibacterium sp. Xuan67W]
MALALLSMVFESEVALANSSSPLNQKLIEQAQYWSQRGRDDNAADAWRKLLKIDPDHVDALVALTLFESQSGNAELAKSYLTKLKQLKAGSSQIRVAEEAVRRGVAGKGQLDDARRLAQQGDSDAAVESYRLLGDPTKLKGDAALEYYQALAGTLAGYNEAKRGIEKLSKENPTNTKYALALAQILTYREPTRKEGLAMLVNLTTKPEVAAQANASWRQTLSWMGLKNGNAKYSHDYLEKHPGDKTIQDRLTNLSRATSTTAANSETGTQRPANKPKVVAENPLVKSQAAGFKALEEGDIQTAETEFKKILKAKPRDPTALGGYGLVKMRQEAFIEARDLIKKAIDLLPKKNQDQWKQAYESSAYWAMIEEARTAFEDSDSAKGIALLRKAVQLNSKEPSGILQLGDALLAENDLAGAEENYRLVLKDDKDNKTALNSLVGVLSLQKRIKDLEALSSMMSPAQLTALADMKANDLMEKAKAAEAAGDVNGAQLALEDAILIAPDNVWLRLYLAQLYLKRDMPGQARSLLDALTNIENPQPDAFYVSALLSAAQQLWWEGLTTMEKIPAKSRKPEMFALQKRLWIYVQLDRINFLLKQGELGLAKELLTSVESAAANEPEFVGAIATLYINNGDPARGLAMIRQAVQKTASPSAGLLLQYADALLRLNQDAELEAVIRQIAALPKLADTEATSFKNLQRVIAMRRAERAREAGDLALAYEYIQPYLIADPDDSLLLLSLARMYAAAGETDATKELYTRVLQTEPENIEVRQGLVYAAIQIKDFPNAEIHLAALLKLQPDNPRFIALAGRVARAQGNNSKALSLFKQALALEQAQHTMAGMGANGLRLVGPEPVAVPADFKVNPFAERKNAGPEVRTIPGPLLKEVAPVARTPGVTPPLPAKAPVTSSTLPITAAPPAISTVTQTASAVAATASSSAAGLPPLSGSTAVMNASSTPAASANLPQITPGLLPATSSASVSSQTIRGLPDVPKSAQLKPALPAIRTTQAATGSDSVGGTARSALTRAPASAEEASLLEEIDALNSLNRSQVSVGFAARARSGEKGLSQLKDIEMPIELYLSSLGMGQMGLKIIPVSIDAGTLYLNDQAISGQFGKNAGINERAKFAKQSFSSVAAKAGLSSVSQLSEQAKGVALSLTYELSGFKLDAGTSPTDFPVRNVVGGLRWSTRVDDLNLSVELSRRSVTDSYLSYAGTNDSLYGLTWGGVTRTGVHLDASYDTDDGGVYASAGYAGVNGKNVASNSMFELGGGAYWRFLRNRDMVATAGLSMTSMFYKKNLRYFSYGQGGYFSPKNYVALGVPLELNGRKGNLAYQVGASVGIQRFTEESSLYYPNSRADQAELEALSAANPSLNIATSYPGQTRSGVQYKFLGGVEYQLAPKFFIGSRFSIDNSGDFTDASGAVYLKYTFEAQRRPIPFPPFAPKPYYLGN